MGAARARGGAWAAVVLLAALTAPFPARAQDVAPLARFDWGRQRPGLVRYNRVEGLSLGVGAGVRFGLRGTPLQADATVRFGLADREPRGALTVARDGYGARMAVQAYRDLRTDVPGDPAFDAVPSAVAFLFGRDDGDPHAATGVGLVVASPPGRPERGRIRLYAERQRSVVGASGASVAHWLGVDEGFRPVPAADAADQIGLEVRAVPRWIRRGGRPRERTALGLEAGLIAERGDFDFVRVRLGADAEATVPGRVRVAVAAAGGTVRGDLPAQRRWRIGGPASLRAFGPGAAVGAEFWTGRVEASRPLPGLDRLAAVSWAVFADAGWAGSRGRAREGRPLVSAGAGLRVLDGLLRVDAAWSVRGPSARRLDLYLVPSP